MSVPKVIISAHCRNPELLPMTTLVFKTLRVGFPTADVVVFDNANDKSVSRVLNGLCALHGAKMVRIQERTKHADWLNNLIYGALSDPNSAPFYLCDTDMVFWKSVEDWKFDTAIAGRQIPQFFDTYTKCITKPRLHTSLLYIDPVRVLSDIEKHIKQFPQETGYNPLVNMVRPFFHRDETGRDVFYDVCSMLSYHVSKTVFTPEQLDCYDHLNCGTFVDLLDPHGHEGMKGRHLAIAGNLDLARGLWRKQEEFYASHAA